MFCNRKQEVLGLFDFGLRIRELREKYKMSQEELGRRVDRSKSVISSYENNIKVPPLPILVKLASIKAEMISVDGLSQQQKELVQTITFELKDTEKQRAGLSERQQTILNDLMKEFAQKAD